MESKHEVRRPRKILRVKPTKYEGTEQIHSNKRYWNNVFDELSSTDKRPMEETGFKVLAEVLPIDLCRKVCSILNIEAPPETSAPEEKTDDEGIRKSIKQPQLSKRKTINITRELDSDTDVECNSSYEEIKTNIHHEFLKKPEREQITWPTRYLEPERENEKTLIKKADDLTDRIVNNFCDYMKQLGGDQKSQLFTPKAIKELFQIEFDTHVARSLKVVPKEMPTVEERIAFVTDNPKKSHYSALGREISKDIKAERRADHLLAFSRSVTRREQWRAPCNDTKNLWRSARHVPRDLVTLKAVWEGITNIRSVKDYCRWMIEHPEYRRAPYLKSLGMFDSGVLDARLTFELQQEMTPALLSPVEVPAPIEHIRKRLSLLADTSYRCAVPLCDKEPPEYAPEWILHAIPRTSDGFDDCSRYVYAPNTTNSSNDTCSFDSFDRSKVIPCDGYVYGRTNSVVYDFGLECQEWLRALAGTLNSFGAMVALPLAGFVSDYFGRRVSIVFFAFNVALVGLVKSFSVNYIMYVTLQFMHTAIGGGLYSAAYILATELVGPNYRVPTSATMSSMFALGQSLLGGIAAAVYGWRNLSRTLFIPIFSLVLYYWMVTESHRWLLSKNKNKRAKAALENGARLNGKKISEDAMNFLLSAIPRQSDIKTDESNKPLFIRVVKSPTMLRRCCTTPVYWIATTFIYYGLSINSVSLSGNMYLNYILTTLIEIPGYWTAYIVLDKVGRKTTLFYGYMLCSLCCIAFSFTPKNMYALSLALYLTGKFSTGVIFTSLYLFTTELYPTRHRHSFLGFSSMLGRIGSVVAPLTPPLMVYWSGIPSLLFAIMSAIAGLLILTQPETRGLKVPDTFEDAELLGKNR